MVNTRAESLTLEKVMCAVDELKKQGLKVTVKSVRDRTGCGSYTTITKFLKYASLVEEKNLSPEARLAQFPQQIEAAFLSAYKELVKAAKVEAANKYEEIQKLEGRLRARWTANTKEKLRALRSLEIEISTCAELRADLRQVTQKSEKNQETINDLATRLVKSESENEQLLELAKRLKGDIETLQRQIEHFERQALQQRHADNQMHLLKIAKLEQHLMNSQSQVLDLSMKLARKSEDGRNT